MRQPESTIQPTAAGASFASCCNWCPVFHSTVSKHKKNKTRSIIDSKAIWVLLEVSTTNIRQSDAILRCSSRATGFWILLETYHKSIWNVKEDVNKTICVTFNAMYDHKLSRRNSTTAEARLGSCRNSWLLMLCVLCSKFCCWTESSLCSLMIYLKVG